MRWGDAARRRPAVWMSALAFAWWELIAVLRYRAFDYAGGDLALFSQIAWNLSRGSAWSSLLQSHFLGNHANVLAYAVAPLYAAAPSPITLLTLKVFCCTFAAIPLYRIAARLLDARLATAVTAAFLLYAPLTHAIVFEFDYEALSPILLLWMWVGMLEGRRALCLVMALLASLLKENLPLVVVTMSLAGALTQPQKRWWIGVAAGAALWWWLAVFVVIPAARGGQPSMYWQHYAHLGASPEAIGMRLLAQPAAAFQGWTPQAGAWLWKLIAPTAGLALLGIDLLLLGLPIWLQRLLANSTHPLTIYYYYNALLTPFVFLGAIYGLRRLQSLFSSLKAYSALVGAGLVGCAAWTQLAWGPLLVPTFFPYAVIRTDDDQARAALLRRIPSSAAVAATSQFLPALSRRRRLYDLYNLYAYHQPLPAETEYVAIDEMDPPLCETLRAWPGHAEPLAALYRDDPWEAEEAVEGLLLLHRRVAGSSVARVIEDVGAVLPAPASTVWTFEGGLQLSAAPNLTQPASSAGLSVGWDLAWKVESGGWGIYDVLIAWKAPDGGTVKTSVIPIGHRVAPLSQWTPGHWMRQTVRVLVPRSLSTGSYRVGVRVIHEATRQPLRVADEQGTTSGGWVPLATIQVTGRAAK